MKLIPIKVECHSGYKADEYPICFYWENIKFEISEISDRWYQIRATPNAPVANYFKVRTAGKSKYILKHELKSDQWFVVSPDESVIPYSLN
ncbi:MAG: cytoplasmic protein [Bacteroidota bacterium]|nr:cytoplasmic protein [Bacteroidota bacterium]